MQDQLSYLPDGEIRTKWYCGVGDCQKPAVVEVVPMIRYVHIDPETGDITNQETEQNEDEETEFFCQEHFDER